MGGSRCLRKEILVARGTSLASSSQLASSASSLVSVFARASEGRSRPPSSNAASSVRGVLGEEQRTTARKVPLRGKTGECIKGKSKQKDKGKGGVKQRNNKRFSSSFCW